MATKTFSMLAVAATLDGQRVTGFADGDDVVIVSPTVDAGNYMIGADGSGLFSQSADRSATVTLKLKHNSPTHRQLIQKWKQQRDGRLNSFNFDVIDSTSGEGGNASDCFIQTPANDQKGTNATVREWVLTCEEWNPETPEE